MMAMTMRSSMRVKAEEGCRMGRDIFNDSKRMMRSRAEALYEFGACSKMKTTLEF
jgi:hypothetical protein